VLRTGRRLTLHPSDGRVLSAIDSYSDLNCKR
jgi:hypothetical protein